MKTLAQKLAAAIGGSAKAANATLVALAKVVEADLTEGEAVMLPGIGKFTVLKRHRAGDVTVSLRFEAVTDLKKAATQKGGNSHGNQTSKR